MSQPDHDDATIIHRSNMFEPLLLADPTFRETWERLRREQESDEEVSGYLIAGEFACRLIRCLEAGDTSRFTAVFQVVKDWHTHGVQYVKDAAIVGLLEDLQNENLHNTTKPDDFLPWMHPETVTWWHKVRDFWEKGVPLV
ncbi:hypothetical protein IB237_23965 [Agrobacterium sp. AGB01]|uniref:DUF7674 family protein n=1 Tax=Agrobacterium sp. AGB01 TaxID=2769302 RepID=UPI00177C777A|nr:hypothetical protein [Agrobacterium sp. AGB01]MBD9390261.1 hypothetical protein [Agrobacterium sp. AGB01]